MPMKEHDPYEYRGHLIDAYATLPDPMALNCQRCGLISVEAGIEPDPCRVKTPEEIAARKAEIDTMVTAWADYWPAEPDGTATGALNTAIREGWTPDAVRRMSLPELMAARNMGETKAARLRAIVGLPADDLTDAERLGILVAGAIASAEHQRDQAQAITVALEQDTAEARRHLGILVEVLVRVGTTFAQDGRALTEAAEFLAASVVDSTHSPEQE